MTEVHVRTEPQLPVHDDDLAARTTALAARSTDRHQRSRWPQRLRSFGKHLGLVALAVMMIYPLIWLLSSSIKPSETIFRDVSTIPTQIDMSNYTEGWNALLHPFGHYMMNSAIVVLGSLVGNLIACSMAAYAFARLEFRGRRVWFAIMLMSIMLPIHVVIVPQYVLFSQLGWINTFLPLIVPKLLATDAFFVFLMVQFFRGIPRELDEAARVDGCSQLGALFRVVLPAARPGVIAVSIYAFMTAWGEVLFASVLTNDANRTLSIGLREYSTQINVYWNQVMAASLVVSVPVVIGFLLLQKQFVAGLTSGSVK